MEQIQYCLQVDKDLSLCKEVKKIRDYANNKASTSGCTLNSPRAKFIMAVFLHDILLGMFSCDKSSFSDPEMLNLRLV